MQSHFRLGKLPFLHQQLHQRVILRPGLNATGRQTVSTGITNMANGQEIICGQSDHGSCFRITVGTPHLNGTLNTEPAGFKLR